MTDNHGYNTDEQSEDESKFASPEDFQVARDSDGSILPQIEDTQLGKVKVIPMAYGDVEEYFGSATVADIGPGQLAEIFEDHVIEPNLSRHAGGQLTADYIKNMKPIAPRELIFAIMNASGIEADVEMNEDGSAEVAVGN